MNKAGRAEGLFVRRLPSRVLLLQVAGCPLHTRAALLGNWLVTCFLCRNIREVFISELLGGGGSFGKGLN